MALRRTGDPTMTMEEHVLPVSSRGEALKEDPLLNKGTCFTREEREQLGLLGLLPPGVSTHEEQAARAYGNYCEAGDDVHRYLFLASLQDRNETLFYQLLLAHLEEMAPIVYTPTVGLVCERFSHIYRRPRGVYISSEDRGRVAKLLANAPQKDCRVIVATDNEAILGLGDLGVGGMAISIGKLALYTAGAGIHPSLCLPLDIDVGTDNEALLRDPLYLGVRRKRLRGEEYFSLLDEVVDALGKVFPKALIQWEDFANRNAFEILGRYRKRVLSFDDDIQGTGAVVVSGMKAALKQIGRPIESERVVFFGAGASGAGCAMATRRAMRDAGVREESLGAHVVALDSRGLILSDRPGLSPEKKEIAAGPSLVSGWTKGTDGRFGLADVVREFKPTVLVGASGQPGAFDEAIVRSMLRHCARPIILPLSNPTSKAEATPRDLIEWTNGAAVVGTGSPFPPVEHAGATYEIGQGNNALIFPGVGLGAVSVGARWLPDEAFLAASRALLAFTAPSGRPGSPIYPPLRRLREVSFAVAVEVARALVDSGAASKPAEPIEARVRSMMWEPVYLPYRPV
jgi:malate dehydrogenase (oxaloacetate-decarboxylating)